MRGFLDLPIWGSCMSMKGKGKLNAEKRDGMKDIYIYIYIVHKNGGRRCWVFCLNLVSVKFDRGRFCWLIEPKSGTKHKYLKTRIQIIYTYSINISIVFTKCGVLIIQNNPIYEIENIC